MGHGYNGRTSVRTVIRVLQLQQLINQRVSFLGGHQVVPFHGRAAGHGGNPLQKAFRFRVSHLCQVVQLVREQAFRRDPVQLLRNGCDPEIIAAECFDLVPKSRETLQILRQQFCF